MYMSATSEKHKEEAPRRLTFAVITVSSSRYQKQARGEKTVDVSGDLICELLKNANHDVKFRKIIPDDMLEIRKTLTDAIYEHKVDVVVFSGGTGVSKRDVTIEAVLPLLEKDLPGFGEIFRFLSFQEIGTAAIVTRAVAGIYRNTLIFCIPGSPQAAKLAVEKLILPEAPHIIKHAKE